jgi:hypothetical protein
MNLSPAVDACWTLTVCVRCPKILTIKLDATLQGPRMQLALALRAADPSERLRVFNTDHFVPPSKSLDAGARSPNQ